MKAEEFIKKHQCNSRKDIRECMIEFAQYHVEQALLFASVNAELGFTNGYRSCEISSNSILTAYPKERIE